MNFKLFLSIVFFSIAFNQELDHPCLSANLKLASINKEHSEPFIYFEKDLGKNKHRSFTKNIYSSYLFKQYRAPMSIIREMINYDYYINDYNNPRYYFLKALEDFDQQDSSSSLKHLNKFISFSDLYIGSTFLDRKNFFVSGCSVDDIDWLENKMKESLEYKIALFLIDYLSGSKKDNELIENLKEIDLNPSVFDLCDNIILMIMNNHDYSFESFKSYFTSIDSIQLNKLIYSDGYNYPLSSQLLALSMFQYFQAENQFNLSQKDLYIDYIQKMDIDNYNHKFLFPLMYYFELKLDLFKEYDKDLFDRISMIIDEIKNQYIDDFDPHYKSWLDFYNPNQDSRNNFIANISNYKNNLINNKNNPDPNYIKSKFNTLVNNNSLVDSIYYTKIFQYLNSRDFFYDISEKDQNSSRIPILNKEISKSFSENIKLDQMLSFSESVSQKTKKIYQSSLLFYYLYDFYNGHESKKVFYKVLKESDKINNGIKPFSDSMKIFQLVLEPSS